MVCRKCRRNQTLSEVEATLGAAADNRSEAVRRVQTRGTGRTEVCHTRTLDNTLICAALKSGFCSRNDTEYLSFRVRV